ncbi:hypothetical protein [Stackebrandtia nassauensis]|uniref:Uncharacterized protein n=1 Tax=Stackebrandtia nassauensis (strain DSM 44728 / CIP 108903 / NRRL B-16338 / NBRC 102104 / LLR-40K-21) TaxID=446470 RepID=D3Q390_STANL|nr:hypothetical protein [Stackebrandtia nassauensis]ADD40060.1 hypothetical protein Snas_0342 [Stackebrandtia nassauensis DSM 44728]
MTRINDKGEQHMQRENAAKNARRNLDRAERDNLDTNQRIQLGFAWTLLSIAEEMNRRTQVQAKIHDIDGFDKT